MMRRLPTALLASLALLGGAALSSHALADDSSDEGNPLGYYIGASLGMSHVEQSFLDEGLEGFRHFDNDRTGWKVLMGVRPIEWLGAEIEYLDFGDSHIGQSPLVSGNPSAGEFYGAHASATAGAGFAVAYLPLPPSVDLFGKLGVSRLQTHYNYSANYPVTYASCGPGCVPVGEVAGGQDNTDTGLAVGIGAQIHIGPFAARLEGERLSGLSGTYLVSVGVIWQP